MSAAVREGAVRRIHMQEAGTRDGLQVEQRFVETEEKIALVNARSDAGLAKIEVTSFALPKAIPQLRDAEILLREIGRLPGVVYTAQMPHRRGAERAIDSRADELNLVMSASSSHNLANPEHRPDAALPARLADLPHPAPRPGAARARPLAA